MWVILGKVSSLYIDIFFPTKHKSSHNFSTTLFDDKVTSDLDFLTHLAPKNNIVSFSPVLRTPRKKSSRCK